MQDTTLSINYGNSPLVTIDNYSQIVLRLPKPLTRTRRAITKSKIPSKTGYAPFGVIIGSHIQAGLRTGQIENWKMSGAKTSKACSWLINSLKESWTGRAEVGYSGIGGESKSFDGNEVAQAPGSTTKSTWRCSEQVPFFFSAAQFLGEPDNFLCVVRFHPHHHFLHTLQPTLHPVDVLDKLIVATKPFTD